MKRHCGEARARARDGTRFLNMPLVKLGADIEFTSDASADANSCVKRRISERSSANANSLQPRVLIESSFFGHFKPLTPTCQENERLVAAFCYIETSMFIYSLVILLNWDCGSLLVSFEMKVFVRDIEWMSF